MSSEPTVGFGPTPEQRELIKAIYLVMESYSFIECGTREPISVAMKKPENELKVFKLVVSLNNLRNKAEAFTYSPGDPESLQPDNIRLNTPLISKATSTTL